MMACVICSSHWEASHCIACVTASTSMVRPEVVTLWAPLSSCTVFPSCLTVNPQQDQSLVTAVRVDHYVVWLAVGFDKQLYFCTGFPAGHWRQCVPRFSGCTALQEGLNSAGPFSKPLTCLSSVRLHTCSIYYAWPIRDLPLASLHPFSSLTASWIGLFGFCIALRYALTCSTLCLVSMDDSR